MTYTATLRIQNAYPDSRKLWVEPWGDMVLMGAGATLDIVATGPVGKCLEVVNDESEMFIYAWPGSTVKVFYSGKIVSNCDIPCPQLPVSTNT
jgi:hypothetical protein